jgi:hypothetical protein
VLKVVKKAIHLPKFIFMKSTLNLVFTALLALLLGSCKETENNAGKYKEVLTDSIFKRYNTIASVTVEVKDGHEIELSIGSKDLFAADESVRQRNCSELSALIVKVFPADNELDKGAIYYSDDEKSEKPNLKSAKAYPIDIAQLKKQRK